MALKKSPIRKIPVSTAPVKTARSGSRRTLRSMTSDGTDRATPPRRPPPPPNLALRQQGCPAVEDEGLDPSLQPQARQQQADGKGHHRASETPQRRDPPAEGAAHQDDSRLADQGTCHEECQRDGERHAGGSQADEDRDRAAGAERGHRPENDCEHQAGHQAPSGEEPADPLRGDLGVDQPDDEDQPHEEQPDLHGVVQEEVDRPRQPLLQVHVEHRGEEGRPHPFIQPPGDRPQHTRCGQDRPRAAGGHPPALEFRHGVCPSCPYVPATRKR